ncbi:protein BatD [candidate division KSB1 bacterium]|nr:protein BatD [candidate division KSB1 bacterium]
MRNIVRTYFHRLFIVAIVLAPVLAVPLVYAQNITVIASISQGTVVENQAANLSVEVSGLEVNQSFNPVLPNLGDWFSYTGTQSSSQSVSIINGIVSSKKTYLFGILPLKTGRVTILPVVIRVGSREYKSNPVTVEIVKAGSAPQPQTGARQQQSGANPNGPVDLFLVAVPDKRSVYQNEGITVEYKVYFGLGLSIQEYTPLNTPNTAGFWTEEYPMTTNPRAVVEIYNDRQYNSAVLKRVELFPTQSGEFEIDPVRMQFKVRLPQRTRGRIFDDFFNNSLFGSMKEITVSSVTLDITSKPLPEIGKPASFRGEVGNYSISAVVDKNKVKEHETITLKVSVAGTGNIKLINEPEIVIPETFERYDPKIEDNIVRTGDAITGEKTFEYVLIPRRRGSYTIEPITIAFFDPRDNTYKVEKTAPFRITVEPGDAIARSSGNLTREEIRLVGQDVRFIKESVAKWRFIGQGQFFSVSFLSLLLTPLVVVGFALIYGKRHQRLNTDIGYRRSRQANAVAVKRLKKAHAFLKETDAESFYPEIARVLQEYIADKLNIAAAGIVTGDLEKTLKSKNIDEDILNSYIACLKTCDLHRFASIKSSNDQMERLYDDSKKVIYEMEERLKSAA